jgi:protoporphyrinogen/coproporphyrinogen III oxidase
MTRERRIVIVGGGITGLSAARAALSRAREVGITISVTVLEQQQRFGGSLRTEREGDFLLDAGPDSWVASKPHATALARELGLEGALIGTNPTTRRYFVARGGALHPVPESLVLGVPTRIGPLLCSGLFSWKGKARMAMEPFVRRRHFEDDEDESIAHFAARRLGHEAADRLVAPLLGGISSADASEVSVRSTFPQLVAMERDYGSLVRGMQAAVRQRTADSPPKGGPKSAFLSLRGGIGQLVDTLVERLRADGATLRAGSAALGMTRTEDGFRFDVGDAEPVVADAVLVAVPAYVAARLLGGLDGGIAGALGFLTYGSTATVFLAYRRADVRHPLDGVGFVVPRAEGRPILAGTWVSSKWAGRAPDGHVLLRAFFGGPDGEGILARDDASLAGLARDELGRLMGLDATPIWSRVFRFDAARAQMRVGHMAAMRGVRERLARSVPGVLIAGGGFDGDGIPDCVRQGTEAGRALAEPAQG